MGLGFHQLAPPRSPTAAAATAALFQGAPSRSGVEANAFAGGFGRSSCEDAAPRARPSCEGPGRMTSLSMMTWISSATVNGLSPIHLLFFRRTSLLSSPLLPYS